VRVGTAVAAPASGWRGARRFVGIFATLAACAVFGFGVAFAAFVALPRVVGLEAFTVLSGSMEPTLRIGDVVIDRPIHPEAIRLGDVVTFRDPDSPRRLLTHRVVQLRIRGSDAYVVTKGDANHTTEHWSIPLGGTLGRVEYRVPKLGFTLRWAGGRFGRLGLILVPVLLLAALELRRIWSPKSKEDDGV
jgi:signal peptidase I